MRYRFILPLLVGIIACGDTDQDPTDAQAPADTTVANDTGSPSDTAPPDDTKAPSDTDPPDDTTAPVDTAGPSDTTSAKTCPPEPEPPVPTPEAPEPGVCEAQPLATPIEVLEAEVNGSGFVYTTPADPKGLILVFHGGGGNMYSTLSRLEAVIFINDAAKLGFAVASLNSVAHLTAPEGPKFKWDTDPTACNPDVVNVTAMVKRLMDPDDLAAVPPGTPLFALGVSNGGSMVSRTAQHLNFSAVASYISNAQVFHEPGAIIPPIAIVAGANDGTVGTVGPCKLYQLTDETMFHMNWADAITPGLFTRIPGIDCAMSQAIFSAFLENGVIDEDTHRLQVNPKGDPSWKSFLPAEAEAFHNQMRDLLLERFGEHSFTSDFNQEVLTYLVYHATPSTPEDLPTCETE